MKTINYNNPDRENDIILSFDYKEKEVMIEVKYDNQEAWYAFNDHIELDDFINELLRAKEQLKCAKLGLNYVDKLK